MSFFTSIWNKKSYSGVGRPWICNWISKYPKIYGTSSNKTSFDGRLTQADNACHTLICGWVINSQKGHAFIVASKN